MTPGIPDRTDLAAFLATADHRHHAVGPLPVDGLDAELVLVGTLDDNGPGTVTPDTVHAFDAETENAVPVVGWDARKALAEAFFTALTAQWRREGN